ncbi:Lrp/AsnC family transcriptional regulator [Deinococcus roseus]|uniref:AsnC family transcriptional regulator n=1 Tax=Deinococcus roseus TaxID=392414 RepID=A0ABQ2DBS0_9DEIO|nr:Lrp/AsnC family transcriptional regulator [Deinococcus roseus]GGJ50452.1 AsnC family transcriptional regulator [Deinococcus roseus]
MSENSPALDAIDLKIIRELSRNARITFTELGKRVGLSVAAVTERVRRLEASEIITGYGVRVNTKKLGFDLEVLIRFQGPGERWSALNKMLQGYPEILECWNVTGSDSYIFRVMLKNTEHLQKLLGSISMHGTLNTSLVLEKSVEHTPVDYLIQQQKQ